MALLCCFQSRHQELLGELPGMRAGERCWVCPVEMQRQLPRRAGARPTAHPRGWCCYPEVGVRKLRQRVWHSPACGRML